MFQQKYFRDHSQLKSQAISNRFNQLEYIIHTHTHTHDKSCLKQILSSNLFFHPSIYISWTYLAKKQSLCLENEEVHSTFVEWNTRSFRSTIGHGGWRRDATAIFSSRGAVDLSNQNCECFFFSFFRGGVQERRCFEEGYEFVSLGTIQGRTVQPHQQYQIGSSSHYLQGFFTSQVVVWDFFHQPIVYCFLQHGLALDVRIWSSEHFRQDMISQKIPPWSPRSISQLKPMAVQQIHYGSHLGTSYMDGSFVFAGPGKSAAQYSHFWMLRKARWKWCRLVLEVHIL